jgi:hypothetical protein
MLLNIIAQLSMRGIGGKVS